MDYGKTLHLPETEFPMRGNLPKREPEILKFGKTTKFTKNVWNCVKTQNLSSCMMALHTQMVNCIGHALNKTLKDIIMKYKTMTGHYTRYIPGWDTHGLPIEHAVIKKYWS